MINLDVITRVETYHPDRATEWNTFVSNSEIATFLFHRDFMEYHQDRFEDYSLMVYNDEKLLAIFPANKSNHTVYSHQGLTYGGLIFETDVNSKQIERVYRQVLDFLKTNTIESVIIKSLPEFYYGNSSNATECWGTLNHSLIISQNMILAIDYNTDLKIHKTKIKRFNKLQSNGFTIKEGQSEFETFWNAILVKRLEEKHNSKPVHSLSEIQYLQDKFQQEIFQYNIYRDHEVLAGITIFKKGKIVKSQYGMASVEGEKLNALDMLFVSLIYKFRDEGMQYFSMGTVSNKSELGFSKGMMKQKQELGCSSYTQNIWNLDSND